MSTTKSENTEFRRALQEAFSPAEPLEPAASPSHSSPDNIRPWGDESVKYVPPSRGNDGYNAGE